MDNWQLGLVILSVLVLPGLSKYMATRFDIFRNTSALDIERVERLAGDNAIKGRCELVHMRVDEKLVDLQSSLSCLDKKVNRLLRNNGLTMEDETPQ